MEVCLVEDFSELDSFEDLPRFILDEEDFSEDFQEEFERVLEEE